MCSVSWRVASAVLYQSVILLLLLHSVLCEDLVSIFCLHDVQDVHLFTHISHGSVFTVSFKSILAFFAALCTQFSCMFNYSQMFNLDS